MVKGYYSSFETFALVDGPGVRSVLFLSGCPYRCLYCHNPETWNLSDGKEITSDEALAKLIRYKIYWRDNGGITISGGEPLLQIDFLIDLFKKAKEKGISTCIDTAGGPFSLNEPFITKFNELLKYTDIILLDLKAPNDDLHVKITGKKGNNVREMYKYLNDINFPIWVRYVLLPGYTDSDEILEESREFLSQFNNIKRIEVLPYHSFAIMKYKELGIKYSLENVDMPTKEQKEHAEKILKGEN